MNRFYREGSTNPAKSEPASTPAPAPIPTNISSPNPMSNMNLKSESPPPSGEQGNDTDRDEVFECSFGQNSDVRFRRDR